MKIKRRVSKWTHVDGFGIVDIIHEPPLSREMQQAQDAILDEAMESISELQSQISRIQKDAWRKCQEIIRQISIQQQQ